MNEFKFSNAKQLVERVLELDYFYEDKKEGAAIPHVWKPSVAANPLVVVVGENAGGKSFFRRLVESISKKNEIEYLTISMEGRRKIGYMPWLALVYGDEDCQATGVNSIRTVLSGISTCQKRETPHVIIWDEPDVGLSEGNAASVGRAIAQYSMKASKHTKASVVITHRKALVEQLLPAKPHYLHLGRADGPASVQEWVASPPVIRPLEEVEEESHKRFKKIQKILESVKASKR